MLKLWLYFVIHYITTIWGNKHEYWFDMMNFFTVFEIQIYKCDSMISLIDQIINNVSEFHVISILYSRKKLKIQLTVIIRTLEKYQREIK